MSTIKLPTKMVLYILMYLKRTKKTALTFLNEQLFETPEWMLDKEIIGRIEYSGSVERIRGLQERTLKNCFRTWKIGKSY